MSDDEVEGTSEEADESNGVDESEAGAAASTVADESGDTSGVADDDTSGWRGLVQRARAHVSTWSGLASVGIVATLIGSWAPWSTDGRVRLGGLEGSHDGWLAALYALVAIAPARGLRRRAWPAIIMTLICGCGILFFAAGDGPPPGSDRSWGWWLTLVGGVAVLASAVATGIDRLRGDVEQRWVDPSSTWRRTLGGVVGVLGTLLLWVVFVRVLWVPERTSWPPPADAITAGEAQAATEEFVRGSPRPRDTDLPYAWSTAATIDPWAEGAEFYPRLFDDVRAAESSIHILMFGWDSNEVGSEFAAIIEQKLAEGVEVRILVDDQGSDPDGDSRAMYEDLVAAGAQLVSNDTIQVDFDGLFVDRDLDIRQDEFGRAEHRKLYVIDGVVAWTGGAGIQDHFLDGRFHDLLVRYTGDVVLQSQAVFLTSFRSHGAPLPDDLDPYFPVQPDPGAIPVAIAQVVPGGFNPATQAMREMIDNADDRLDITNPYLTDADIIQRLEAAAKRGVAVRIVVAEDSNNVYAEAALSHHYGKLIDAGAEIWEYPDAVIHGKVLVADDQVVFGTVNLDAWALYRDFEFGLIVDDHDTVELFERRLFEPDVARSNPARPPTGLRDRSSAWVWDKLSYFL
jgi:cardiolipin synthase